MGVIELPQRRHDALSIANREHIISFYKRLRAVGQNLGSTLMSRLSKDVLDEGGRKLGILCDGMLVFETEDETSVLADYCIYDVRRNGRNAIEQYLIDCPPDPESDEMTYLRAMQRASYSLFVVESVEHGLGVIVRDLRSANVLFVVDMGLGLSAQPGLSLASRLLHGDEFSWTGGAALPLGIMPANQREALAKKRIDAGTLDDKGYSDPAPIIRACLSNGFSANIQYADLPGLTTTQQQIPNRVRPTPVGRNSPCPCGSGKKFKRCCLKG